MYKNPGLNPRMSSENTRVSTDLLDQWCGAVFLFLSFSTLLSRTLYLEERQTMTTRGDRVTQTPSLSDITLVAEK